MRFQLIFISLILLTGCTGTMPQLGIINGQLTKCPATPNCVSSQTGNKDQYIDPLMLIGTSKDAQTALLKILHSFQRTEVKVVEDDYIRAEFTSAVFRFVDDVEFYFPETKSEETPIQVRSSSRIGYTDFGANRKRIEKIRKTLNSMSEEP